MARKKQSAVKAASSHKRNRKEQLARARKCRKIESEGRKETETSQESASQIDEPQPSTSTSNGEALLGEKTRTQFKSDSYKTVIRGIDTVDSGNSCETGHPPVCDPGAKCERAIVDIAQLDFLIKGMCCKQCKTDSLSLRTEPKKSKGLAVYAQVYCSTCEEDVSGGFLASRSEGEGSAFVINKQIVFSALVCGLGANMLNSFCEAMNLQGLHHKTFHKKADGFYDMLNEIGGRVFSETEKFMRQAHAQQFGLTLSDDDVLDISVSFDGTWLTRGHTSHIGVGCAVDLLTGMCVDAYVMCNFCQTCESTGKALFKEKPTEHAAWLEEHLGECEKNFTGKSFEQQQQ